MVPLQKESPEFQQLFKLISDSFEMGNAHKDNLSGYPRSIFNLKLDKEDIVEVTRIQNYALKALFLGAQRFMEHINQERPPSAQFQGSPVQVGFHGTSDPIAALVAKLGFKVILHMCTYMLSIYDAPLF